jgi:hypothetical protein
VASGAWSLDWSDGKAASGSLDFGDGYRSPNLSEVGTEVTGLGLKLGLLSGKVYDREAFTVDALTPRDTFQYTIAEGQESDFTPPIVVVSYNDPQQSPLHDPLEAMTSSPTDDLTPFAGRCSMSQA